MFEPGLTGLRIPQCASFLLRPAFYERSEIESAGRNNPPKVL